MSDKTPCTGRLARGAIAGLAVARAGAAHLSHRAQCIARTPDQLELARAEHEAKLGRILFSALNQLKGTALKASQLLSMEVSFLPEAMRQQLAKAHFQVTPLNRALVIKLLRQEFGRGPDDLFSQFEPQAFAAASLGQVHGATLVSGEAVAVKLQYPGMAVSVGSDMAMLRALLLTLARGASGLPNAAVITAVLADIEATLAEELDYSCEAEQLAWFGQAFAAWPELVVPQTFAQFSSKRVLTMQRVPGMHLNEWLASKPAQAERDRYGQILFNVFLHSCFNLRRVQADPHAGNSLFMPDGRLGLLDFGCTKTLSAAFCSDVLAAWRALLRQPCDTQALQRAYVGLGLVRPNLSEQGFGQQLLPALQEFLDWQLQPFRSEYFDFGQHPPPPRLDAEQQRFAVAHLQHPSAELPYFDRSYLGLMQTLRTLGARVRTANQWIHA